MSRRKTPAEYHELATKHGFRWLGPEVSSTGNKTTWQCYAGHSWEAVYDNILQGKGCPYCAGVFPKAPEDYRILANQRGFKWLGPEVKNIHTKTWWECSYGHRWLQSYRIIKHLGNGCPQCASRIPLTITDYLALAKKCGLKWLGPKVPNNRTKTKWQCGQGHTWEATSNHIREGTGCPFCVDIVNGHRVSGVQRRLCNMLAGSLNHPIGPYAIDVAIHRAGVPIAVEYDAYYWHSGREDYDTERNRDLISAGWHVLRIKSGRLLPTPDQLEAAVAALLIGETYTEIVLSDWSKGRASFAGRTRCSRTRILAPQG